MLYSQRNDQLAEGIAFVVAKAYWLARLTELNGPNRGRDREIECLKVLLDQLAATFPESTDEAYELGRAHHEHMLERTRNRDDRSW